MMPDAAAILAERARMLARPPLAAEGELSRLVSFALGNERYAVEARFAFAAFRPTALTPLPGAPPPVFGLTSWRGELLTVLDLREQVGVAAAALADLTHVIVVGDARPAVGLLAGAPLELVTLPVADVRPAREGAGAPHELVRAVTPDALQLLDVERLLRREGG